jgi:hypothetical protein
VVSSGSVHTCSMVSLKNIELAYENDNGNMSRPIKKPSSKVLYMESDRENTNLYKYITCNR